MNAQPAPTTPSIIHVGNLEIRYLQEAGNGLQIGCFEMRVPPNAMVPPPHRHPGNEELVYVLEGTLRYTVDDDTRDLHAGDCMATPRGAIHAFANPHAETVRALVINNPDIGSGYFREVAAVLARSAPADKAGLVAIMNKYGLVPAGPTQPAH